MEQEILAGVHENIRNSKSFAAEIRSYLLNPKGPVEVSTENYSELVDGIIVKDITSQEQFEVGITVLRAIASKEVDFGEHEHERQSQIIYVLSGKIYDLQSKFMFKAGQSFLVPKGDRHAVRYFPNTEVVIVYMPKLFLV